MQQPHASPCSAPSARLAWAHLYNYLSDTYFPDSAALPPSLTRALREEGRRHGYAQLLDFFLAHEDELCARQTNDAPHRANLLRWYVQNKLPDYQRRFANTGDPAAALRAQGLTQSAIDDSLFPPLPPRAPTPHLDAPDLDAPPS